MTISFCVGVWVGLDSRIAAQNTEIQTRVFGSRWGVWGLSRLFGAWGRRGRCRGDGSKLIGAGGGRGPVGGLGGQLLVGWGRGRG